MTPEVGEETEREIRRRQVQIAVRWALTTEEAQALLGDSLELVRLNVAVRAASDNAARLVEARARLPRDPTDAPTLALALALDCDIWTTDRDFFGCGVAVWSTETLLWWTCSAQSP